MSAESGTSYSQDRSQRRAADRAAFDAQWQVYLAEYQAFVVDNEPLADVLEVEAGIGPQVVALNDQIALDRANQAS